MLYLDILCGVTSELSLIYQLSQIGSTRGNFELNISFFAWERSKISQIRPIDWSDIYVKFYELIILFPIEKILII